MKKVEQNCRLLVIDVDGTLTDGGIYYDAIGNEIKKFCTKDAAGIFAVRALDIKVMVLTGRKCDATSIRMKELKIDYLVQNVTDKADYLKKFMASNNLKRENVAYIGDDLNDLPPMQLAGYIGCPADACKEIKDIADYVSIEKGGHGAVRDIIEHRLREIGKWGAAVSKVYGIGE